MAEPGRRRRRRARAPRHPDELPLLLETAPDRYFQTPHYHSYPIVLVHLDRIERDELHERIEDSWLLRAPKRLVQSYAPEA